MEERHVSFYDNVYLVIDNFYVYNVAMFMILRHQRTNNVMGTYNLEFSALFDSPKPGPFVFCERVKDEALHWESRHKDSLLGRYTHRQKRNDVMWPEVPQDFDGWSPKKKTKNLRKFDF